MSTTTKPKIIIVDNDDQIIGFKYRADLDKNDLYRVSALWITNSHGDILLSKRHHTKINHPEKWHTAVAGTVEVGETYEENIIKEAEEELGLKNIQPTFGPKTKNETDFQHFTQWFLLNIDKKIEDFKIQEDEVEEIKWFTPVELKEQLQNHLEDFVPTMKKYFELFSTI